MKPMPSSTADAVDAPTELPNAPMNTLPPPGEPSPEWQPLLSEPLASGWAVGAPPPATLRQRLLGRAASSRAAAAVMHTRRRARVPAQTLAAGVQWQPLYAAEPGRALRPGEPLRAGLLALAAGSRWPDAAQPRDTGTHREWLVLQGSVDIGAQPLALRDYRVQPAGSAAETLSSAGGALLFLRESAAPAEAGAAAFSVLDAQAGWPAFAPGIRRRVLWQHGGQAALLYHAEPGAAVPRHSHGHDEECLMVQGELYLDDLLLQAGDYQLAPAGSGHEITHTDTGVVIYAHGDLDLQFLG